MSVLKCGICLTVLSLLKHAIFRGVQLVRLLQTIFPMFVTLLDIGLCTVSLLLVVEALQRLHSTGCHIGFIPQRFHSLQV